MATGKREFKHPWSKAGPLNHLGDKVDPDQLVVNKEPSLYLLRRASMKRGSCKEDNLVNEPRA